MYIMQHVCKYGNKLLTVSMCLKPVLTQGPVVQSIVSLTISLRHKFVKQISAKVTNTVLFFVEKNERIICRWDGSSVCQQLSYRTKRFRVRLFT